MKKNNKKAFTLVELLVVIAIIAILAVVSVVGYTAFTKKAKDSVAQQELSQFITLITAEDAENGNTYDLTSEGLKFQTAVSSPDPYTAEGGVAASQIKTVFFADDNDYAEDLNKLSGKFKVEFDAASSNKIITKITYMTTDGGTATWSFKDQKFV